MSNDSESDSATAKLAAAAASALAKQALDRVSNGAGGILTDLEETLADKQRDSDAAGDTLLPAPIDVDEDLFEPVGQSEDASDVDEDHEHEAALRLEQARDELAKMKAELGASLAPPKASSGEVSPDAPTQIITPARVLRPSRRDPLDAAEQALAMAAQARGVPLELPSRVPPDRSDPFSAATQALETARLARGGAPKVDEQPSSTSTRTSRVRDPFKAAEEALKRAQEVRAQIGVSPHQEERESAARRELARLHRLGPSTSSPSSDDAPASDHAPASDEAPKKRDL